MLKVIETGSERAVHSRPCLLIPLAIVDGGVIEDYKGMCGGCDGISGRAAHDAMEHETVCQQAQ